MFTQEQFKSLLDSRGTLIIDGGLATELENRGHDLNHPLWSAKILEEDPMGIKQTHLDYYIAGADIAITASYQASTQGLADHIHMDDQKATALIKRSVTLARLALEESYGQGGRRDSHLLVAGSVGPYGAYLADGSEYRGDYQLTKSEFKDFHRPRISALVEADVDVLAIETMPNFQEIEAVLELLHEEFHGAIAWISCTLKDSSRISDGTSIEEVLRVVHEHRDFVVAFGINCVPTEIVKESLQNMRYRTDLPLLCYPNTGETWDAQEHNWSGSKPEESDIGQRFREWRDAGARLIGGCCRTGPQYVMAISKALER